MNSKESQEKEIGNPSDGKISETKFRESGGILRSYASYSRQVKFLNLFVNLF